MMGLVIKVQHGQRIFFDDLCLEVSKYKGQIKLHFNGKPPFPFEITRESVEQYKSRMEENDEGKVCSLQQEKKPTST